MSGSDYRRIAALCLATAIGVAVVAGVGVFGWWRQGSLDISAVLAVKAMAMAAAITFMVVMAGIAEGSFEWGRDGVLRGCDSGVPGAGGVRVWRSVRVAQAV
ncbi:MAG: hypothetical protein Q8K99_04700 [Actinomycetota bacterium]|nr:hypothetical protein [Actinomycetota bacterium]